MTYYKKDLSNETKSCLRININSMDGEENTKF